MPCYVRSGFAPIPGSMVGVFGVEADGASLGKRGIYHRFAFNKESVPTKSVELQEVRGILRFQRQRLLLWKEHCIISPVQTSSRPGVGRTTGWKERDACRGDASGEQGFFHWESLVEQKRREW